MSATDQMVRMEPMESVVKRICGEFGVAASDIKAGLRSLKLDACRDRIVAELRCDGRTSGQIAMHLKMTEAKVLLICKRKGVVKAERTENRRVDRFGPEFDALVAKVCKNHGFRRLDVIPPKGVKRKRWEELVRCRMEIVRTLYDEFGWSMSAIGRAMNYKDHTSVYSLLKKARGNGESPDPDGSTRESPTGRNATMHDSPEVSDHNFKIPTDQRDCGCYKNLRKENWFDRGRPMHGEPIGMEFKKEYGNMAGADVMVSVYATQGEFDIPGKLTVITTTGSTICTYAEKPKPDSGWLMNCKTFAADAPQTELEEWVKGLHRQTIESFLSLTTEEQMEIFQWWN